MRLLGTVAVVVLSAATVRADPPPAPPAGPSAAQQGEQAEQATKAGELFREGRALLESGDNPGACAKFDQAIRIDPDAAGTMLNLGLCNEKLGRYKTALFWYRKALDVATVNRLSPESKQAAQDRMIALTDKVATVSVTIAPAEPQAIVVIDGEKIRPESYGRVEVDPGKHVLDVTAPHKEAVHRTFDVNDQRKQVLTVSLEDAWTTVDRGHGRRVAGVAVMAAGGALLVATGVVAGIAKSGYPTTCANQACIDKAHSKYNLAKYGGTTLFFGGVAAVAAGAYLYFFAPAPERVRMAITPVVGPTQVGLSLGGSF